MLMYSSFGEKVGSSLKPIIKVMATSRLILFILSAILFVLFYGDAVSLEAKAYLFSFSNAIRKVLIFSLPFLVFPYLVVSISSVKTKSTYLIGGIALLILLSNFVSIMLAYGVGTHVIPLLGLEQIINISNAKELPLVFDLSLKPIVEIELTMMISLILGIFLSYFQHEKAIRFIHQYMNVSSTIFQKIYVPILPIYILGTLLKLSYEMDFAVLLAGFGPMIVMILSTQLIYIFCMYFVGSHYSLKKTWSSIRNASPAALVGFSTMSSIVTMPITLKAAEKNIDDKNIARIAIGSTVNCHDVGECISLPMIGLTLYYMTFASFPPIEVYCVFAMLVAAAQFTGVSVPGGSVIIILPFLSKYLGFTPDMLSLIIAISIFMDPVGTANNVMGNGAFAMIINRIHEKFKRLLKK